MERNAVQAIERLIEEKTDYTCGLRHRLHRIPEVCFKEHETSALLRKELEGIEGLIVEKEGYAPFPTGTGIVAHLPATACADGEGSAVGLRADIDGLPVAEETGKDYASEKPGFMHACGHDGHMAVMVGTAHVLSQLPDRPFPVTFLFQPAEEGGAGAKLMVEEGALKGVDRLFGVHGMPMHSVGHVALKKGPLLASAAQFSIEVVGVQAHGAWPHLSVDPVVAASHIVLALQTIVSRNVDPLESVVVTIGKMWGGTAHNIIPSRVSLLGTLRTFDMDIEAMVLARMRSLIANTAEAFGCSATLELVANPYPVTSNNPRLTEHAIAVANDTLGVECVEEAQCVMGGEDFSFYGNLTSIPTVFMFLGQKREGEVCPSLHQPTFDFRDESIPNAVRVMCQLALASYEG